MIQYHAKAVYKNYVCVCVCVYEIIAVTFSCSLVSTMLSQAYLPLQAP
jgi:hypothetical protein